MVSLSASKINTYLTCSFKAWQKYHLNFPSEPSNDGIKAGLVTHDVLEYITHPKRKKHHGSTEESLKYLESPAVNRLIKLLLKKQSSLSDENIAKVKGFIQVAIKNNLIRDGYLEYYRELPFKIKKDFFIVNGLIDQLFIYEDKAIIVDFKTNKSKPPNATKEGYFNLQGLIYEWAVRELFGCSKVETEFHYLKFKRACVVKSPESSKELLEGLGNWLEYIANYIKNFNAKQATSNLAYSNGNRFALGGCGGCLGQTTKDGRDYHICEVKYSREYFVLKSPEGKVIQSAFLEKDLTKRYDGCTIERRVSEPCPAWTKKQQ